MPDANDNDLVREFAGSKSEVAFAALVRQHVNLVFATAMRQIGDRAVAEEIAQSVFVALAQSAGRLGSHPTIAGWLHQTALNKSREWLRSELRRRKREQTAVELETSRAEGDSVWSPLVPLLDEALLQLRAADRAAVLMHYMEGRTFREVGSVLGVAEDTARKRVDRCLEQLIDFFQRRGFAIPASSATAPLFALASHSAPAHLAAAAITAGLAAPSTSTSTLTLKGALKIMAWTKAKTAIVAGTVAILAVGTTTPVVVHIVHQHEAEESLFASKTELTDADNAKYLQQTGTTPAQVSQDFFDALAHNDSAGAAKFCPPGVTVEGFLQIYGGMEVINLGKPFTARISVAALVELQPSLRHQFRRNQKDFQGPQVYVPYEIRLKNGSIKKWQLAIRCDNPEHHWYFDGGM